MKIREEPPQGGLFRTSADPLKGGPQELLVPTGAEDIWTQTGSNYRKEEEEGQCAQINIRLISSTC